MRIHSPWGTMDPTPSLLDPPYAYGWPIHAFGPNISLPAHELGPVSKFRVLGVELYHRSV